MPRPWADQPYSLLDTRSFSQNTSHAAYYVETQMSLAHNGIIRGLNSIYLQASNPPTGNEIVIRDFFIYCQCWSESMHHHHDAEEAIFFPDIERITEMKGTMEKNVEQHRAFTPEFDTFYEYCRTCPPEAYDGEKSRSIVEPLRNHPLNTSMTKSRPYERLISMTSEMIHQAYRRFEKTPMATDNYRITPLVFGTADRSFEGGVHNFPAVPFFVPYVIHYTFGM